jgi:hypothetical protein
MKIARQAQNRLGMRLAQHHRPRQLRQDRTQIKSAVESVRGFRQVDARVLALPDRVVPWGLPLVVLVAVSRWMASSQVRNGSLVASKTTNGSPQGIGPLSSVV